MAYGASQHLPFETASKLGHLSVINSPFVQEMLGSFDRSERDATPAPESGLFTLDLERVQPLEFVIAVDGSLTSVPNTLAPHRMLSYIKIAALNLSLADLRRASAPIVNPEQVSRVLSENADTESTVLPLSNVRIEGRSLRESIREAIQETFIKFGDGQLLECLRFLVSQEWNPDADAWKQGSPLRPHFRCPACAADVPVPRSEIHFHCGRCSCKLTIVDYLGLLLDVNEESNDESIAFNLMGILEHLTLLNYLRWLVSKGPALVKRVLLLRDGPLMLRGQYSRLVDPIRGYLQHLHSGGFEVYLAGIEKDGAFVDYIPDMASWFQECGTAFLPDNEYILRRIKHSSGPATRYGEKVLYGSKLYYRVDRRHVLVLNMPNRAFSASRYDENPKREDLIGIERVLATLQQVVSHQHENAVMPIVAVNRIASMSFYPSNNILERFTEAALARP